MCKKYLYKMIKQLFIYFIGLMFLMGLTSNDQSAVYHDFGVYTYNTSDPHTYTQYRLYIEKHYISEEENANAYIQYKYKYVLKGMSFSRYDNEVRNTYMNDFNIYLNDDNHPFNPYPLNFYIKKSPTILYEVKSNDPKIFIRITWESSFYDSKH